MSAKKNIIGGIIAIAIGGTIYQVSSNDIANNLTKNTNMTQEQAQEYAKKAKDNLVPYDNLADHMEEDAKYFKKMYKEIDCAKYKYKWQSDNFSCKEGKQNLKDFENSELKLANAYRSLSKKDAGKEDVLNAIEAIDLQTKNLDSKIVKRLIDIDLIKENEITKQKNGLAYNKSSLQTALKQMK